MRVAMIRMKQRVHVKYTTGGGWEGGEASPSDCGATSG